MTSGPRLSGTSPLDPPAPDRPLQAPSANAFGLTVRSFCWGLAGNLSKVLPLNPARRFVFRFLRTLILRLLSRLQGPIPAHIYRMLQRFPLVDWFLIWLQRYYPFLFTTLKPDPLVAARGLGPRGSYPIPLHIWDKFVPSGLLHRIMEVSPSYPAHGSQLNKTTAVMVDTLILSHFFAPCGHRPNCSLFVIPKTTEKCSLIADLRFLNTCSPDPLPTFHLPTVRDIGIFLERCPYTDLYGVTFDLKNFYWSLLLPPAWVGAFRIPQACYTSLPFGWNLAPILAQSTLLYLLDLFLLEGGLLPFVGQSFWFWVYLDDVLVFTRGSTLASQVVSVFMAGFLSRSLVPSPKCCITPDTTVTWIGRHFDLRKRTIDCSPDSLLRLFALALLCCLYPLTDKRIDVLMGHLNWLFHPRPGYGLFSAGWYALRWNGERNKGYASPGLISALLDGVAICCPARCYPVPCSTPLLSPFFFTDAAEILDRFQIGIFSKLVGARFQLCPAWVRSQQTAELFGLLASIRLAFRLGMPFCTIVGDNLASMYTMLHFRPYRTVPDTVPPIRSLFNMLWNRDFSIHLYYCPSILQPADPISRLPHLDTLLVSSALLEADNKANTILLSPHLLTPLGSISFAAHPPHRSADS